MTLYLFYTHGQPEVSALEHLRDELAHDPVDARLIDADSVEGVALAQLYDVLARPYAVGVRTDGSEIQRWEGVPSRTEVLTYSGA